MAGHRRTERELADALIEGVAPPPHRELAGVAAFLEQLPAVAREPVRSELEDRHITAMSAAYRALDTPEVSARKPFPLRPRPTRALRSAAVKTAVACLVLFSAGGALAATGNLPAIQDQVADAVNSIVDLPGGSDDDSADIEKGTTSTTDDATGTEGRDASNGTREDGRSDGESSGRADSRVTSDGRGSTRSTQTEDEATDEPDGDDGSTPDPADDEADPTDEPDTDNDSGDTPEEVEIPGDN